MDNKKAFENHFKDFSNLFLNVILLRNDVVHYSKRAHFYNRLIERYGLISRINQMTLSLLIIKLYNLLKESEAYSFEKTIKKHINLICEGKKNRNHTKLINNIRMIKNDGLFEKVKNLRNKHFAHFAHDRKEFDVSLSIEELDIYIKRLANTFIELNYSLYPELIIGSLEGLSIEKDMFMFEALDKYSKIDDYFIESEINSRKQIPLNDLRKILEY